jgi:Ca2+-binding RTX toxin-like protein
VRFRLLLSVAVLLIVPPQAYGARVGLQYGRDADGAGIGYLSYWGDTEAREANQLSVRQDGNEYVFTDEGADIEAYPGCSQEAANIARCGGAGVQYMVEVITWASDDRVDVGPLRDPLRAWGESGDDFIKSESPAPGRSGYGFVYDEIDGGPGDDHLLGGPGSDVISGGKFGGYGCNDPAACGGREAIDGRDGDDVIQDSDAINGTPVDRDVLGGGPGNDTLDYSVRHVGSVRVSLDPASAAWVENEDDISGFEDLIGTSRDDRLTGDGANNTLTGGNGSDLLFGQAGGDALFGGGASPDGLVGGPGADSLYGSAGPDRLRGGPGTDLLRGSDGRDRFHGGGGADEIRAADGIPERVYCGAGSDTVWAGPHDRLIACEHVAGG